MTMAFSRRTLISYVPIRSYSAQPLRYIKRNWVDIKKVSKHTDLALSHFDGLYGKVYGRSWPSLRLGLLSPKKHCAILNTFVDNEEVHNQMVNEVGAIHIQHYYKKHLTSYTRWQLRQQLLENKRARKRELMAKNQQVPPESIDLDSIQVSDISDNELKGLETTDGEGFSTAADLQDMFSDRRLDEDEKYFINRASTQLSLEDYIPASEFIYREDVTDELSYYDGYSDEIQLDCEFRDEPSFIFDDHLKTYVFPRNCWERFANPTATSQANLLPYYLLDGASILPVMALDIQFNDECADYCASPGGKSLAMLMSLKPAHLLCNDISQARVARLTKVIQQYLPDIKYVQSTLSISRKDASSLVHCDRYDKILVDVPCSNDRQSVTTLDNNLFKRARTEERLRLPITQCNILKSALKSLKPKGATVYSTCTMSPIENDGVVQRALLQLQEEGHPGKFAIMNLKEAFRPLRGLFKFKTNFKYGQQVVPNICNNFGPMYISKIKRLS